MNTNPYTPPKSDVDTKEFVKGKWYKAVLIGILVDMGGSIISSIILVFALSFYFASTGMPEQQIRETLQFTDKTSPLGLFFISVGSFFSLLGGYVCARIANHHEYRLVLVVGIIQYIIGIIFSRGEAFTPVNLALVALSFALLLTGAHYHVTHRRKYQNR